MWVCVNRHVQRRGDYELIKKGIGCAMAGCGTLMRRLTDIEHAAYLVGGEEAVREILPELMTPGILNSLFSP